MRVKYIAQLVGLAVAYIVAAKLGLSLAFSVKQITSVWPPTGLALVAVLLLGYRVWPGVFVGALVANWLTHESAGVATGIAAGNTLEAVVGAWLLMKVVSFRPNLSRMRDMLALLTLAAVGSTMIAATIGTASLMAGGLLTMSAWPMAWLLWWFGDMAGDVLFAPFLLVWLSAERRAALKGRMIEAVILLVSTGLVAATVFFSPLGYVYPIAYITFPLVIWGALRFAQLGVATVSVTVSVFAILGTAAGYGPFGGLASIEERLIFMLLYVMLITVSGLLMAIIIDEREAARRKLLRQTQALAAAGNKIKRELVTRTQQRKQLQEANDRITKILERVLEEPGSRN